MVSEVGTRFIYLQIMLNSPHTLSDYRIQDGGRIGKCVCLIWSPIKSSV